MSYCWVFMRVCCRKLICSDGFKAISIILVSIAICYGLGIVSSVILGDWDAPKGQGKCTQNGQAGEIIGMCFAQGFIFGFVLVILALFLLGFYLAFQLILNLCRTSLQQTEEEVNHELLLRGDVNADILNV